MRVKAPDSLTGRLEKYFAGVTDMLNVGMITWELEQEIAHTFRLEPLETPVCHMAVVFDPDGNSVTIHRRKIG